MPARTGRVAMTPSKARNPAGAGNTLIREVVAIVTTGALLGVILGSAVLGMADSQRIASVTMQQSAMVAELTTD